MKEGWKLKTLGDIGKVSMCKRVLKKQTNSESGIPFYKIGTFGKQANAFISEELYKEFKEKYSFPKKGDILLSASGTIGRRVVYDGKPAYFQDSNIVWIANDESEVTNEYLYTFYGYCKWNPSKGATISRLYNDDLRRIQIPIPPLSEQKQIVAILDEAFEAIDQAKANIERNIQNAQELFQSKLNQVFSQKGEGWEEVEIKTLCEKTKNIKWGDFPHSEFEYLDLSGVSRESLTVTTTTTVNQSNAPSRAKKIIHTGDVLFATTRPTLKRVCIIPSHLHNHICSTGYSVLRLKEKYLTGWIFYYLQSPHFMKSMRQLQRGANYPAVTDSDVKNNRIIVNKPELISKKTEELDKLRILLNDVILKYHQKLSNLEELKKSLLQKAFTGELTAKAVEV